MSSMNSTVNNNQKKLSKSGKYNRKKSLKESIDSVAKGNNVQITKKKASPEHLASIRKEIALRKKRQDILKGIAAFVILIAIFSLFIWILDK